MTPIVSILEKAKAFILDFDGTLVDSNTIKRNAFEKCFLDYPDPFDAIMAYCKNNNHIPRQKKFRHVFENILKLPYTKQIEEQMLACYAKETTEQVILAKEIPGGDSFFGKMGFREKQRPPFEHAARNSSLHPQKKKNGKIFPHRARGPGEQSRMDFRFSLGTRFKTERSPFYRRFPGRQPGGRGSGRLVFSPPF